MKILQAGMAKSGNYWLYTIIQTLLDQAKIPQSSFIRNHPIQQEVPKWKLTVNNQNNIDVIDVAQDGYYCRISTYFREQITDIDSYVDQCTHIWTHSSINQLSEPLFERFDKIVYIVRDPRDIAISRAKFAFTPYYLSAMPHDFVDNQQFLDSTLNVNIQNWGNHIGGHLVSYRDIHFVFYENLLHNLNEEINILACYLGLQLSTNQLRQVEESVTFDSMKSANPNHVRRGQAYKWTTVLDEKQNQAVLRRAGQLLNLLGYPLTPHDVHLQPRKPDNIDAAIVNQLLSRRLIHSIDLYRLKTDFKLRWFQSQLTSKLSRTANK